MISQGKAEFGRSGLCDGCETYAKLLFDLNIDRSRKAVGDVLAKGFTLL